MICNAPITRNDFSYRAAEPQSLMSVQMEQKYESLPCSISKNKITASLCNNVFEMWFATNKLQLAIRTSVFNRAIAIKGRMNEKNAFPWLLE